MTVMAILHRQKLLVNYDFQVSQRLSLMPQQFASPSGSFWSLRSFSLRGFLWRWARTPTKYEGASARVQGGGFGAGCCAGDAGGLTTAKAVAWDTKSCGLQAGPASVSLSTNTWRQPPTLRETGLLPSHVKPSSNAKSPYFDGSLSISHPSPGDRLRQPRSERGRGRGPVTKAATQDTKSYEQQVADLHYGRSRPDLSADEPAPIVASRPTSDLEPQPTLHPRPRLLILLAFIPLFLYTLSLDAATRRYRLSWRDNPATSITIGFEIYAANSARVVYDTQDHGRDADAYRLRANPSRTVNHAGMRNVFVRLGGLRPGTTYYFLVVDEKSVSRRMSFETPPDNPDTPLSIVAGGDSRNNRQAAVAANQLVSKLRPHFVLFGGDMTNTDTPAEWQAWFDDWQLTISQDGRLTPIVPARGNHERANASIYNLFDVPHPDVYYALSFGGGLLRTYTLNTLFPPGGHQLNWLTSDLSRAKAAWKIAQYHHPMRPHTRSKPERDELITLWATQFTRYGVNLVVESDAHTVKQTWPIRPSRAPGSSEGFIRDDKRGTVYVGEGCWGAPLRANDDPKPWTRSSGRFNQFKWIWLDGTQMQVRTVDIDRSAGTVAEVNPQARFQTPPGVVYWRPEGVGEVLRIPRRRLPTSTDSGIPVTDRSARMQPTEPAPPAILTRNAQGAVRVSFRMPANGQPQVIVVDAGKNLLWQKKLAVRGPGPYNETITLPALPNARGMELVIRAGGKVAAKYILR